MTQSVTTTAVRRQVLVNAPISEAFNCAGWESVRDGVDDEAGWPLYLQRFAALFERNA
jgi:hypothetical protein